MRQALKKYFSSSYYSSLIFPVLLILVPLVLVPSAVVVIDHSPYFWSSLPSSSLLASSFWGKSSGLSWKGSSASLELHATVEESHEQALSDSASLNHSSFPPKQATVTVLPLQAKRRPQLVNDANILKESLKSKKDVDKDGGKQDDDGNKIGKKSGAYLGRELSKIERIETGLTKARVAIRKAARSGNRTSSLWDPDYTPIGPIYRNAHVFHRSYLEMEKAFKIFVYPEGEPPLFHDGPCKSIYSTEGRFIHDMELGTPFRTMDHEEAHMYFLPFSVAKMVGVFYIDKSLDTREIKRAAIGYVDTIARKYPYWNRSLGADHFMLSCHDWGPDTSVAIPDLYKNSVRVLCNANSSEGFNPAKDAALPEINLVTGEIKGLTGGPSPSRRTILGFFAGGMHGPIRPVLLEHWKNKDQDLQVYEYLPKHLSYKDMMKKSKYCICPSGYEVASPRVVEAIYAECVPVIISEHYVLPFSEVLDWKSFSVSVQVNDIPKLKSILMGISTRQYIRMQRRVKKVQKHFVFNRPAKRYDLFHMILHSVWLRRLNVRVHGQPNQRNGTIDWAD